MDLFLINLKYTLYMILLFQVQALFVFPKYSLMEFTGTRKLDAVKDSDLLEMTSLKKLPSETRTEALLVKYVAYFGICQ